MASPLPTRLAMSRSHAKHAIAPGMTDAQASLIETVTQRLGPRGVITDPREIEPWVNDWRGRVHGAAAAILAPSSTAEAAEIARLAAELKIPLVPQGVNTGMAGGATPPA